MDIIKQISTQKPLTPNEKNFKVFIDELIFLYGHMPRKAYVQKKIVLNVIEQLRSNKASFKELLEMFLYIARSAETKETKAITARLLKKFIDTYKNVKTVNKKLK